MRKLTTQEFIDRARAVHGDRYGYAFSIYLSATDKVIIHCPEHGMFEQSPNNHINSGTGCPSCGNYTSIKSRTKNQSDFINQAKSVHGNKYDYSKVEYVNTNSDVKIICSEHGLFEQRPSHHLNGVGCPSCSGNKKHNNVSFITEARIVHGDRYDYSMVDYLHSHQKVSIRCIEHGVFEQTPNNHLHQKSGCPSCMSFGFDRTSVGFLYVLRSDCGQYMKIGITNDPERRNTELTRYTPFSFKRIELIEGSGDQIANFEKELLAEYQPAGFTETFDGYSEWRLWDDSIRHKLSITKL